MKTSELTGAQLDYWVARAEGIPDQQLEISRYSGNVVQRRPRVERGTTWRFSTDWSQGGPIIERERASMDACCGNKGWYVRGRHAPCDGDQFYGDTLLIAAMRCYVASKFGDAVPHG